MLYRKNLIQIMKIIFFSNITFLHMNLQIKFSNLFIYFLVDKLQFSIIRYNFETNRRI